MIITTDQRNFDQDAASWDGEPRRVKLADDVAQAISDEIALTPEMDVLDFGCGTGLLTLRLRPFVRSIAGADSSQGMLDILKTKIQNQNLTNMRTLRLDPVKGEVLKGRYHLIVSLMTFHHVRDVGEVLHRFHDLLVPLGHVAIADLDLDGGRFHVDHEGVFHNGFDREELRQEIEDAGFHRVRHRTATEIMRPTENGEISRFSVFLMTGRKGA